MEKMMKLSTSTLALTLASPALAHGGGVVQLANAEAGPYLVSVWTQPDPPKVGTWHVTVAVVEPSAPGETGDPVLDAAVTIRLVSMEQNGETLTAPATRQGATNKLFYEADLELPTEGQWRVEVFVEGPAGAGETSFEITASSPASGINWALVGGIALTLVAGGWLAWTFRPQTTRLADRPQPSQRLH